MTDKKLHALIHVLKVIADAFRLRMSNPMMAGTNETYVRACIVGEYRYRVKDYWNYYV